MKTTQTKTNQRSVSKTDEIIGERVRLRRLELAMSQERLAELLGITFQQIQKYEKGINRMSAVRLLEIADALDTPIGKFYYQLSSRDGDGAKQMLFENTSYASQLTTVLVSLSDNGRELLLETARTFLRHDALKRRT